MNTIKYLFITASLSAAIPLGAADTTLPRSTNGAPRRPSRGAGTRLDQ